MTTSAMMVTYNRLELTKRMFDNFLKTTDSNYRLIVIDNGSTDGTVEWLKQLNPSQPLCQGYRTHFNPKNMGIAIGRNQGLLIADQYKDPYLCTIDNDIELHQGWLTDCLNVIKTNPKFAIGVNFEGTEYPPAILNGGYKVQWKRDGNLGTALTVFNRKLHEEIGFFIMDFGLYGEEDADFFFRARQAGWKIGYLPTKGIHFGEGELDTGEYREFKTAQHQKNLKAFQKNCWDYMGRMRSIFIPFKDESIEIDSVKTP
jgi:O-antigen biosynthesis protein